MADGLLILQQTNFIKLAFVHVLQQAFAHPATPEQFRYAPERQGGERQIGIYRAWPKKTTMMPCIMVEAESADVSIKTLGDECTYEEIDENTNTVTARIYSGVIFIPVSLSIYAKNTTTRELLTDLVGIYTRYMFRQLFHKNNIEFLDIRAGDDGQEEVDGEILFKGKVDIKCQTEFEQRIDMSLYEAIQSINIDGFKYGTSSTDLTPIDPGT